MVSDLYHPPLSPWYELIAWFGWAELWVYHEQHVGKPCAKVDTINMVVA